MASKDSSSARPISTSSLPVRQVSRNHSHSVSLGATNVNHRISRRKSVTNNNAAALAAAMRDGDASALSTSVHRRSLGSKKGLESTSMGSSSGFGAYLAKQNEADRAMPSNDEDAAAEGGALNKPAKQRNRRASEGAYLTKTDGKRVSGELKCDTCGKGYKHSSCLTKHMWEHDPAWAVTSKF